MKLESTNPSENYAVIGEVDVSTCEEIAAKVKRARAALPMWTDIGLDGRIGYVRKLIDVFENRKGDLADLMSREMGMPITQAEDDMKYSIEFMEWYAAHAHESLDPEKLYEDDHQVDYVYREPRGVVAVIVPWNFPMSNFVWQVGQNLLCGNTIVFKHSEETQLFGKALEDCFRTVNFPGSVFEEVYGDGTVGDALVHQDVDMICFTGSTKTGQYLARVAGEKMIPVLVELGGSAPGIVCEDADIDKVLETIYINRFLNSGQACDALKRLIVHESKAEELVNKLKKLLQLKKVGKASERDTDFGPLVAERQVKLLEEQVTDAIEKGAEVIIGAKRPAGMQGAFYEPTILTHISYDMRVWQEEVFGPVLPVVKYENETDAILWANDTIYGLGGYVFTENKETFDRFARQLKTGMVAHNNTSYIKASNPFGGYKKSGLGREHGTYGFHELTQVKVVSREK